MEGLQDTTENILVSSGQKSIDEIPFWLSCFIFLLYSHAVDSVMIEDIAAALNVSS